MLQNPLIELLIDAVSTVEGNNFFGRMLIAVNSSGIDFQAEIDKKALIFLMNRLIALSIGFLDEFNDFWVLDDPSINI